LGYATNYNDIYIDGSVENWDFIAYYGFYDEVIKFNFLKKKNQFYIIMK
jgi:hypothetical protein